MKQTTTVNIGGAAFTLDNDACEVLKRYFDDIRMRLPENDAETMGDIERGVAEMLREKTPSSQHVVTLEHVRASIARMGSPSEFGNRRDAAAGEPSADTRPADTPRRLYRPRTNRSIAGVCSGIARHFDLDPTLVRVTTLLLILLGGLSVWVYVILWIVIPEEPARQFSFTRNAPR